MTKLYRFFLCITLLWLAAASSVRAQTVTSQIVRDGTVGPDVTVQPIANSMRTFEIGENMGSRAGTNLFHSFRDFSIGTGDTALFTANTPTNYVITRVTGSNPSSINGTIRSTITGAQFYFLNPKGIFFGPNAALDLRGSFHAATADVLRMKDASGREFTAFSPDSLLRVATPFAFGFLSQQPAGLTIQGSRLRVPDGQQLHFVAGSINMTGGRLTASGGSIGLVSAAASGDVKDDASGLDTTAIKTLGDISLKSGAILSTSEFTSEGAGQVVIRGGQFVLSSSRILADVVDSSNGKIDIDVRNTLSLQNGSAIRSLTDGDGNAAAVRIHASQIEVLDESRIESSTAGSGRASDIAVDAGQSIKIANRVSGDGPFDTGIASDVTVGADGSGGSITIQTPVLSLQRGVISSETIGLGPDYATLGRPGSIDVRTNDLQMTDEALITNGSRTFDLKNATATPHDIRITPLDASKPSSIRLDGDGTAIQSAATLSTQSGAAIHLQADDISLTNGALIDTAVFGGIADAGKIDISANQVSLRGGSLIESDALIHFGALQSGNLLAIPAGNGGDISIHANKSVLISEPALFKSRISTSTFGTGDSGSIRLDVVNPAGNGTIEINNGAIDSNNYSQFAAVSAGKIQVTADVVRVENGGLIESVAEDGTLGTSGQVTVAANHSLTVHGADAALNSPSAISTSTLGKGNAGSVNVSSAVITVDDGASIDSFTYGGPGKGGDIHVGRTAETPLETRELTLERGGKIAVSSIAGAGDAGTVDIHAETVRIEDGGRIVASTILGSSGNGGSISLSASGAVELRGVDTNNPSQAARLEGTTNGPGKGGNINLQTPSLSILNGARLIAASNSTAANAGAAGSIFVGTAAQPAQQIEMSGSLISAYAVQGPAVDKPRQGNIQLVADQRVLMSEGSSITASVANGLGGNITISGKNQMVMRDSSQVIAKTDVGNGGRIQIGSNLFIKTANSAVSADAGVGNNGIVTIDAPEVDLQSGLTPPAANFLNASSLLQPACAIRPIEQQAGRFVVSSRRGAPISPEDLLQSFDFSPVAVPSSAPSSDRSVTAATRTRFAEAEAAFRSGHLEEAGEKWSAAGTLLVETPDRALRGDALRNLAQTQQALGDHLRSIDTVRQALSLAEQTNDSVRMAAALGTLGNAYLALGQPSAAEEQFNRGVKIAASLANPSLQANLMNNLGNLQSARRSFAEAVDAYEQSATLAQQSGDLLNSAKALANAARSAIEDTQTVRGIRLLQQAIDRVEGLATTFEKAHVQIHIAATFQRLAELDSERRRDALLSAFSTLDSAAQAARQSADLRALSYALGNLGALYQVENRSEEALYLIRQALRAAEEVDAPELLYRWHWKEGQILWSEGHAAAAIESYRRAVEILEQTRQEALSRYNGADVFFRQAVAPVYVDLTKALLQASAMSNDANLRQQFLRNARETVERLKAAEVRDYFRDECVADLESRTIGAESVGSRTAIVYPILLPERLELLITLPSGLERYTVAVDLGTIQATVDTFRRGLQRPGSQDYLQPARSLYRWLVEPYAARLSSEQVETIVFVPDGVLRTVPMSALHNGSEFLAERYGVVVTPGLALVDPKPIPRQNLKVLVVGLSVAVQGQIPLPAVDNEVAELHRIYGTDPLLNERFTTSRLEREMTETQPSVVHIASHATFTGDAETSWILTYDSRVTMQRLSEIVGVSKFRDDPLELLVLSACETAEGDERAALGLAGVALRAGARSAMGSLWPISDAATSQLIARFYEELKKPGVSRAAALQRAQQALIQGREFSHPFYWSAFLMIGNWL